MPIVTLTTDFGTKDFYAGVLKGEILKEAGEVPIVDISHHIEPYDISEAAFVIKNCYSHFPKGTIHLVCVNDIDLRDTRCMLVQHQEQFFMGFDNGIFNLIFDDEIENIFELAGFNVSGTTSSFPSIEVFPKAIGQLVMGKSPDMIGKQVHELRRRTVLAPVVQESLIRGTVIYVDGFKNVITNIRQELFESVRNNRGFEILYKRNERITRISKYYHDVMEGEKLCLFNSAGYLEIAINTGKAGSLLGLRPGDIVQVDFK